MIANFLKERRTYQENEPEKNTKYISFFHSTLRLNKCKEKLKTLEEILFNELIYFSCPDMNEKKKGNHSLSPNINRR